MSDAEINLAIAEACGWRKEDGVWTWTVNGIQYTSWELRDYVNDLNAMHEVEEQVLLKDTIEHGPYEFRWQRYMMELFFAVDAYNKEHDRERLRRMIPPKWVPHATARQRAEAFLQVISKKEEA